MAIFARVPRAHSALVEMPVRFKMGTNKIHQSQSGDLIWLYYKIDESGSILSNDQKGAPRSCTKWTVSVGRGLGRGAISERK